MATIDDLYEQLFALNKQFAYLNKQLLSLRKLQSINGEALPGSRWWLWIQKTLPQFTIASGATSLLLDSEKDLPTEAGYFHSLDLQVSTGGLKVRDIYYTPQGQEQKIEGTLSAFWVAEFSPRIPASAGDPIVVNRASDAAASYAISNSPEWAARVSPSKNVPFNVPFKFSLTNTDATTATVYGADFYFLMLSKEAIQLTREAESEELPDFLKPFLQG